jgi:cation:H+ antiporter
MASSLLLLLGVVCAALGGEFFVKGAVGLARWARVSPGIIGVTVAAFATSSPELSVSINSALAGTPQIALGDALGSNVVNIALILATVLVLGGIRTGRHSVRRDFPVALAVPLVTAFFAWDGVISRLEGAALLAGFLTWLAATVHEARRQRRAAAQHAAEVNHGRVLLAAVIGLALLVVAGMLIVDGARGIARSYGLNEFVIGATLVAIGTSVPELATAVLAKLRGHDEIGLGTLLGSNVFNGLFIVSIAALIHPIPVAGFDVFAALAYGVTAVALTWPARDGAIGRSRGVLLLALYVAYVATVLA